MATYVNEYASWGNKRRVGHRGTNRAHVQPALGWWTPEPAKPLAWNDVANWKGKNVWGIYDGKRQLLHIMGKAPEGNDGERWYVMPSVGGRCSISSCLKAKLELTNTYALAIRPETAIVVYAGANI